MDDESEYRQDVQDWRRELHAKVNRIEKAVLVTQGLAYAILGALCAVLWKLT